MWGRTQAHQRARPIGWVCLVVALMIVEGVALTTILGRRHRTELGRATDQSARLIDALPDWYAPQQGRRLRVQPLRVAIYGTPSLVTSSVTSSAQ